MIKPWMFEFLHAPPIQDGVVAAQTARAVFENGIALWTRLDTLGFEGIFFSEHHFGVSYSPSPNLLIASIAQSTRRLRLGTMGMVLPLYQPWRVLEEIGMLDHMTGGRLEIGCASGVPQELIQIGMSPEENRDRFNESLEILDAWLTEPVISHHGRYYNFDKLRVVPRPLQPSPPKWTTVVSTASATKSAARNSKICTAFESVARVREIFDAYRAELDRHGVAHDPDQLAIRRNVSVAASEAEASERSQMAKEAVVRVLAGDPRVRHAASALPDAPSNAGNGFSVHADEFIAGTPPRVAEQIIAQCRACGAGHFVAILGRAVDRQRIRAVELFADEVIPILRQARIA